MAELFQRTIRNERVNKEGSDAEAAGFAARIARMRYEAAQKGEAPPTLNDIGTDKFKLRKGDSPAEVISALRGDAAKMAKFTIAEVPVAEGEAATGEGEIAPVEVAEAGLAAETVPEHAAETEPEHARIRYRQFIDNLELPDPDKLKLKEMMSEPRWQNALATAKELKASRLPTYEQVVDELTTFSLEKLRDICAEMEIPRIVIESDQSFDGNIAGMDENKHYTSADGRSQEDTYVNREQNSPYENPPKPGKVITAITDGKPRKKQLSGVTTNLRERREYLTRKFAARGMKHISLNGMAALLQQSLRQADLANDKTLIVDNWEDGNGTITFIDPSSLTEFSLVAYALFASDYRRAAFDAYDSEDDYDHARGRASVQVLEI